MNQITNKILMVRPSAFGFNAQTAVDNCFQHNDHISKEEIQNKAAIEFDNACNAIKKEGVNIISLQDFEHSVTPDSIFPNNWFVSIDKDNLCLSSMAAKNRQMERKKFLGDLIENINSENINIYDMSVHEKDDLFIEGTGVLILDRINKYAFASISPRCSKEMLIKFCEKYNYTPIDFMGIVNDKPIYHTNVMMSIGKNLAIVCLEIIKNADEKQKVINALKKCNKEIIDISLSQVYSFAGNMIEIKNQDDKSLMIMSNEAFCSLTKDQISKIITHCKIIPLSIPTIEKYGGGSTRCMIAEIFG